MLSSADFATAGARLLNDIHHSSLQRCAPLSNCTHSVFRSGLPKGQLSAPRTMEVLTPVAEIAGGFQSHNFSGSDDDAVEQNRWNALVHLCFHYAAAPVFLQLVATCMTCSVDRAKTTVRIPMSKAS